MTAVSTPLATPRRALAASVLLLLAACGSSGTGGGPPGGGGNPEVRVPSAPSILSAIAGNGEVSVTWAAPTDNGGTVITGYQVRSEPDAVLVPAGAGARQASVKGLRNGTSYTFTVTALNSAGQSEASQPSPAVTPVGPPAAPTAVAATSGNGQATVSWTAPTDIGGSALTDYSVAVQPSGAIVRVDGGTTQAIVTGLTNGTAYTFTVSASNAVGTGPDSTASAAVTPAAPPGAPTNVTLSAGNASATLTWNAPMDTGGSALTGYTVTVQPGGRVVTVAADTLTAIVDALQPGALTTFHVSAVNAVGPSTAASVSFYPFGFQSTASLTRGGAIYSTTAGDFDKNGKLDLVCVDYLFGYVTAWMGNGDGTFPTFRDMFVAANLTAAAVADFNKDGNPDIAVASNKDNSVSLRLGKGDGTFLSGSTTGTGGSGPKGLVTADFNADGNADLLVAHEFFKTGLRLLPGRGDGTFSSSVSVYTATEDSWAVTAADMDRDGKVDVATTTRPSLNVLRSKGDGTFDAAASYSTSGLGHSVVAADFNNDGAPDLATAVQTGNLVAVLLNTGTGTFHSARTYATAVTRPESITAGDFNQDGHTDLALAYLVSSYVTFLFNRGDGTFYTAIHYNSKDASFVDAQDVNGDGKKDLVISSYNTGATSVWLSF